MSCWEDGWQRDGWEKKKEDYDDGRQRNGGQCEDGWQRSGWDKDSCWPRSGGHEDDGWQRSGWEKKEDDVVHEDVLGGRYTLCRRKKCFGGWESSLVREMECGLLKG